MKTELCKYYNFHGADDEGEYVSCDLEENLEIMCSCKGDIGLCYNQEKLEEVTRELGTS